MAKINGNVFVNGIRGMIGKQIVYKERNGKPYTCAAPTIDENRKPTPNQKIHQERVSGCSKYGKAAIRDADLKNAYQAAAAQHQSAYNVAWMDAWHPPAVHDIIANGYKGNAGDVILVHATDNFKVTRVSITILDSEGKIIEEGEAASQGVMWKYAAQITLDGAAKIVATAFDLPGNTGVMEVLL